MIPAQMCRYKRYVVTHKFSDQKYPRRSLLVFLGLDADAFNYGGRNTYVFSGRDFGRDTRVCGTTEIEEEQIISVEPAGDTDPLYINQRA